MSYWKTEKPIVFGSMKNEIRIYSGAGKIQVFPKLDNTAHGVGKGATLDLESMSEKELVELKELFVATIDGHLAKREMAG